MVTNQRKVVIMFVPNSNQKMSINDSVYTMPEYLKKILLNSWAHPFQKYIFPAINEERFSVLYSDKGSRPNTPVNVIIGALILKEIFDQTDEELIGSIYFDDRYQYALRLTSEEKPPVSYNTFTNFRNRVQDYIEKEGIDLIKQEIESLSDIIAEHLEIKGEKVRVDSFMISTSAKNMSRIELIYTVNYQFIKMLNDKFPDLIPEECKSYLKEGHKNETIYRTKDSKAESKVEFLLKQSKILYDVAIKADKKVRENEEFKSLKRMLGEQTKDDNDFDNIEPKDSKNLSSDSLQNPNDPDATYRFKYDDNVGYVANIGEIFDGDNCLIKFYDFQPNIYSDQQFCKDSIERLVKENSSNITSKANESNNIWDNFFQLTQMFVDGTYFSYELANKALKKGISLIPGELAGKKPALDKTNHSEFQINPKTNKISKCPDGKIPEFSIYHEDTKTYSARFSKEVCNNCSIKECCRVKELKNSYSIKFSKKQYEVSKLREKINTEDYQKLTNQRAGIEGLPSVFRRKYNVDNIPVRGSVRSKIWFGFKVGALNVKRLFSKLGVQGV